MYGAITSWEALKAKGKLGNNFLVMGPWRHSQINRTGTSLGPFQWNGDTAKQFRAEMVLPLFNQYLKDGPPANLPSAAIYNTGENHWDRLTQWPLACQTGCAHGLTPLYLGYEDIWEAADRLGAILESGRWREPRFAVRGKVT